MLLPVIISCSLFAFLSALHVYWAFNGQWGKDAVVPTDKEGRAKLNPGPFITLVVAVGLLLFAIVIAGNTGIFDNFVGRHLITWLSWGIAAIFGLRATGDFHYVGLFKKVKDTPFARNDTRLYTPLCVVLFVSCIAATF